MINRIKKIIKTYLLLLEVLVLVIPILGYSQKVYSKNTKLTQDEEVIFKINVMKNGNKIKSENITAGGLRETYKNIKDNVENYGVIGVAGWKEHTYKMNAVTRCGLLLETFAAAEGIKNGALDATPAVEKTTYDIIVAISQINEETKVSCEKI
ncbi:MAG: hypothetical protein RLZ75_793 [Pseudomonadota bacterium]|jgi:hypothetical protein